MKIRIPFRIKKYKIGDTPLIPCLELQNIYDIPNLLIKDESRNEFGTFKDRKSKFVIEKAVKDRVNKLAIITSGAAGYSLARLAEGSGIKVVCIVDKTINHAIMELLERYSDRVIQVDWSSKIFYEHDVLALVRETTEEVIRDVTNEWHDAFQLIIKEIKKENPDWLITPVGSGESYWGLYQGLEKYKMKTKLVGAGVHRLINHRLELRADPSIADKLYTPYTPYKSRIEETLKKGHLYLQLTDEEIRDAYEKVSPLITCEPSSAAAFAALPKLNISKDDKVIVINSGKLKI